MKKIRKSFWRAYWRIDKKMLVARLKAIWTVCPEPQTHRAGDARRFAIGCPPPSGKAVYDIGRNDGSRITTDHAGQVELSVSQTTIIM